MKCSRYNFSSDGELGGCQRALSLALINQMPLTELSGAFCAKTWQIRMIAAAAAVGVGVVGAEAGHSGFKYTAAARQTLRVSVLLASPSGQIRVWHKCVKIENIASIFPA